MDSEPKTSPPPPEYPGDSVCPDASRLTRVEQGWRAVYDPLIRRGYCLPYRYNPLWTPSWLGSGTEPGPHTVDAIVQPYGERLVMHAINTTDDWPVFIKIIDEESRGEGEWGILKRFFVDEPERYCDPRNHCAPLIHTMELFNLRVLVFPLLRTWESPPMFMAAEALPMIRQLLEGLVFLHENGVYHGDIYRGNIMMDATPLFPEGRFPHAHGMLADRGEGATRTRLQAPVRYYYVDISGGQFPPEDKSPQRIWVGLNVNETTPPEVVGQPEGKTYDALRMDIWMLGAFFTTYFQKARPNSLPFLDKLFGLMTHPDPGSRPRASICLEMFKTLTGRLSRLVLLRPMQFSPSYGQMYPSAIPSQLDRRWKHKMYRRSLFYALIHGYRHLYCYDNYA